VLCCAGKVIGQAEVNTSAAMPSPAQNRFRPEGFSSRQLWLLVANFNWAGATPEFCRWHTARQTKVLDENEDENEDEEEKICASCETFER
jgi:hypothetical protein